MLKSSDGNTHIRISAAISVFCRQKQRILNVDYMLLKDGAIHTAESITMLGLGTRDLLDETNANHTFLPSTISAALR